MSAPIPFTGGIARITSIINGVQVPVAEADCPKRDRVYACDVRFGAEARTSEILWTPDMPKNAINAAVAARDMWASTGFEKRLEMVQRAVRIIEEHKEELASLLTLEMGKHHREAIEEAGSISGRLVDREAVLRRLLFVEVSTGTTKKGGNPYRSENVPVGVAGIVGPFNYEYRSLFDPVFTALLAGNTVVMRPSTVAPRAIAKVMEWIKDVFPAGVLNCLFGGHSFGTALAESHDVDAFFFTGGVETGLDLQSRAVKHGAIASGELGGQGVLIIADDVSDEEAVDFIIQSFAKRNVNQNCNGLRLVQVEGSEERTARIMLKVQQRIEKMIIGDPSAPDTDFGPMAKDPKHDFAKRLRWMLNADPNDGAPLDGVRHFYTQEIPSELPQQGYWQGAVLYSIGEQAYGRIFNRNHTVEVFGPAVGFATFKTADEAVQAANRMSSRLTGVVLCRDPEKGQRLSGNMRWGHVYRNVPAPGADSKLPWGGWGTSIVGHWGGPRLPEAFVNIRNTIQREL